MEIIKLKLVMYFIINYKELTTIIINITIIVVILQIITIYVAINIYLYSF